MQFHISLKNSMADCFRHLQVGITYCQPAHSPGWCGSISRRLFVASTCAGFRRTRWEARPVEHERGVVAALLGVIIQAAASSTLTPCAQILGVGPKASAAPATSDRQHGTFSKSSAPDVGPGDATSNALNICLVKIDLASRSVCFTKLGVKTDREIWFSVRSGIAAALAKH